MRARSSFSEATGWSVSVEAETDDDKAILAAMKAQGMESRGSTYDATGVLAIHFGQPTWKDPK